MPCTLKAVKGWMCRFDMAVMFTSYSADVRKPLPMQAVQTDCGGSGRQRGCGIKIHKMEPPIWT